MNRIDLEALKGSNANARKEAIASIQNSFGRPEQVLNYAANDPKSWLYLYQSLFVAIKTEADVWKKKGTAPSQKRLEDAGTALRWLVEKTNMVLDRRTVDSLIAHLKTMPIHRGVLIPSIALNYAKTLNAVVSYPAHIYHLTTQTWAEVVTLCFQVLLGADVGGPSPLSEEYDDAVDFGVKYEDPDTMDVDDGPTVAGPSHIRSPNGKRGRPSSPDSPEKKVQSPQSKKIDRTRQSVVPVSKEQIEYGSILLRVFSSPKSFILETPTFVGNRQPDEDDLQVIMLKLQKAVCNNFSRFFSTFPVESSAHLDVLSAFNLALTMLELNAKQLITEVGIDMLPKLLALWGTKSKEMKEQLLISVRLFFPFITLPEAIDRCGDGLWKLWKLLDGQSDTRGGIELLNMDSLRLQLRQSGSDGRETDDVMAFVKITWQVGHQFNASQAVTWAALELQSDCLVKLHATSEVHFPSGSGEPPTKRQRRGNPVETFLTSLEIIPGQSDNIRCRRLQFLLFFIDRHWVALHPELQHHVCDRLILLISDASAIIQSWSMLCLAAVVAQTSKHRPDWEGIWSFATRRIASSTTCRAACHLANALLVHKILSPERIYLEVENLAKELDVQGPTFPYDSVCAFMCEVLRLARQDVRMSSMRMEEKVLSWLCKTWSVVDGTTTGFNARTRLEPHSSEDVRSLMQSVCQLSRAVRLEERILLPDCAITKRLLEEHKKSVMIRFLLHAELPPPLRVNRLTTLDSLSSHSFHVGISSTSAQSYPTYVTHADDLAMPEDSERKCTVFLQRSLEAVAAEWATCKDAKDLEHAATREKLRRSVDIVVLSLTWEASLILNGTNYTRKIIQPACKLIEIVVPVICTSRWSIEDKAVVLQGLSPLVDGPNDYDCESNEAIIEPGPKSGVKRSLLVAMQRCYPSEKEQIQMRTELQKIVWAMVDVRDMSGRLFSALRKICLDPIGQKDANYGDGFGNSIVKETRGSHGAIFAPYERPLAADMCLSVCVAALTRVPMLQSGTNDATRDKILTDIISESINPVVLLLQPHLFRSIRRRELHFTASNAETVLQLFEQSKRTYELRQNHIFWLRAVEFMDCSLYLWLNSTSEITDRFVAFADSLSDDCRFAPHPIQEAFISFLERYLQLSSGHFSKGMTPCGDRNMPRLELQEFSKHEDFGIRFRVAASLGRLFNTLDDGTNSVDFYHIAMKALPKDVDCYERMVTRILSFGNIMVSSSAVRHFAYWSILEVSLVLKNGGTQDTRYHGHIEAVLRIVASRIGMSHLSDLFRAYCGPLAVTTGRFTLDLTRIPRILGSKDKREFVRDCFSAVAPVLVAAEGIGTPQASNRVEHTCFGDWCRTKGLTPQEGVLECLPEIFALRIAFYLNDNVSLDDPLATTSEEQTDELGQLLLDTLLDRQLQGDLLQSLIRQNLDKIVVSILGLLNDTDFSQEGPLVTFLSQIKGILSKAGGRSSQNIDGKRAIATLAALTKSSEGDFVMHTPNKPSVSSLTIVRSLLWLDAHIGDVFSNHTVYHAVAQLFGHASRAPVVNEQMRYVRAITLLVSLAGPSFVDSPVLRALLRGSTALLAEPDLARTSRNILTWGFESYRQIGVADPILPDILIRLRLIIETYPVLETDDVVESLQKDLRLWLDEQAAKLFKVQNLANQAKNAVALWPTIASNKISPVYQLTATELSHVLEDDSITSSKFSLVRRMLELAVHEEQEGTIDMFTSSGFWRLKTSLRSVGCLDIDDAHALSDLVFVHAGRLRAANTDLGQSRSVAVCHRSRESDEKRKKFVTPTHPLPHIIQSLVHLLSGNSIEQAHSAYECLRKLVPFSSHNTGSSAIPSDVGREVEFFKTLSAGVFTATGKSLDDLSYDVYQDTSQDFQKWICLVTSLFADVHAHSDPLFAHIVPVLETNSLFAEQLLPVLVHALLHHEAFECKPPRFSCRRKISAYFGRLLQRNDTALYSIRSIVDVVLHLRHFQGPDARKDPLSFNKWLDIDCRLLSKSAVACGAYTTALLFLEMTRDVEDQAQSDISVENVLFDIYSHIDEPDGFYAIRTADVRRSVVRRAEHEGRWDTAFSFHGAASQVKARSLHGSDAPVGVVRALQSFGFDQLAMSLLHLSDASSTRTDLQYTLGWRTETWDLPLLTDDRDQHDVLYSALRAVHRERRSEQIHDLIATAYRRTMGHLRDAGNEDMTSVRRICRTLLCLRELSRWRTPGVQRQIAARMVDMPSWQEFLEVPSDMDFPTVEALIATRVSLLHSARQRDQREQIGNIPSHFTRELADIERQCLLGLSKSARAAGNLQIALNAVTQGQSLEAIGQATATTVEEFANVLWVQGEHKLAVEALEPLLQHELGEIRKRSALDSSAHVRAAVLMSQLGIWAAEACLERANVINEKYFTPVTELLAAADSTDPLHGTVYYRYALFADRQYQAILTTDLARLELYIERKKLEIDFYDKAIKSHKPKERSAEAAEAVRSHRQYRERAQRLLKQDTQTYNDYVTSREMFLRLAIQMFSRCLCFSDLHDDDAVIRMCSRWFSNFADEKLNEDIQEDLQAVASFKLVFLVHQLSARMYHIEEGDSIAQENLQSLVTRICRDHPFHSLYQVFALKRLKRSKAADDPDMASQKARAAAALSIFQKLTHDRSSSAYARAKDLDGLCEVYLAWADYPIKNKREYEVGKRYQIPKEAKISQVKHVNAPVTTAHTALDRTCLYRGIVKISRYENHFSIPGGLNKPKISTCVDEDGNDHKQLFKGEGGDDLRQDAVMEQVFALVNLMLERDRETRKRQLSVRTYKVVPLAAQAGVLEFVSNTEPLQGWLKGAHHYYHPDDWQHDICRQHLSKDYLTSDAKLQAYKEIMENFHPVMRHFFTESCKTPVAWFAMRLSYARSVATTSMVGHILGLGDRHLSNILMDQKSGEVVHIDLGIAFDQGQLLPIPETVPFRLTPDMVDGLGMSGTDGVFQKCAENTLRVLREESVVIKTLLEVFRYDPLHTWTASPMKMQRQTDITATAGTNVGQEPFPTPTPSGTKGTKGLTIGENDFLDIDSGVADELADRVLNSVARKLDKALSVEYTVNQLVIQARDMKNLSQIYSGWCPWM